MKLRVIVTLLLTSLFTFSLFAIEGDFSQGKDLELQKAKELEDTEKVMDKKIQKVNEKMAKYFHLKELDIKYTPGQTIFNRSKDEGYIELRSYEFIPQGYSNRSIGHREKWVRLYFDGNNQLTRVVTRIQNENFREDTQFASQIIDPSPKTEGTEDIQIKSKINRDDRYDVPLGKIENTITNPLRLKFKREYYIPHLVYFEKLFRFTAEYQKRYGTNTDEVTIDTLKKSLEY